MYVRFGFALLSILVLGAPAFGQVFSDGVFDPAGWTLQVAGDGTVDAAQELTMGNPDEFRRVATRPVAQAGMNVGGWHLRSVFVYDPSAEGAIGGLDWSIDYENLTTGQAAAVALEQDGTLMLADTFVTTFDRPGWFTHVGEAVAAEDFGGAGPDFTGSGAPITFGFYTANTFNPAAGDVSNDVGYDNFTVTLLPVPEPGACALLCIGAAVLLGARQRRLGAMIVTAFLLAPMLGAGRAHAQTKPNVLVIWGDDIGITNLSAYSRGLMGYQTPNIDRIAKEGMLFTDYYGDQSCTAGRSSFITGQSPFRTGLSKVGVPGAELGLQAKDPTIAELLKPHGYATGQFGKNHLGDKDEFLPTNHGFDEFQGNLYHLNAEEEPELDDYPKAPGFREQFGPRGVIHSSSDGKIQDTGPLTRKRMETVDQEFLDGALDFIGRSHAAGKPFFVWFNSTRMHFRTHIPESIRGTSGQDFYADAMVDHDRQVGVLLDKLDALGIAENTLVFYSTDNGPHYNTWPDAANTPFRGEKNTNWEGGYRVPALVRWPGKIEAGAISNEIMSHLDWAPTILAAAGAPGIKKQLLAGTQVGGKSFRAHLDGYDFLPYLTGSAEAGPRREFLYFNDDGLLVGARVGDWKTVFAEQRAHRFDVWREPFVFLRIPKIFHLRRDPFERADTESNKYNEWWVDRVPRLFEAQAVVTQFLGSLREFPPSQRPATFTIDQVFEGVMQQLGRGANGGS